MVSKKTAIDESTEVDRISLKRRLGRLFGALRLGGERRRVTLLYHAVGDGPWATPAQAFERHVQLLAERARLVSLDAQWSVSSDFGADTASRPSVALTFDDGYACLYDHVLPILRDFGATATVFVNTEHLGETAREGANASFGHYPGEAFLTWRETAALAEAGWEVGSHGLRHDDLTQASFGEARRQSAESKMAIEVQLSRPCTRFAYTWGRHTPHVREAVRLAGYLEALTGAHGPRRDDDDPFCLPRINIAREYSLDDLRAIIAGDWDYLGWVARARAALG